MAVILALFIVVFPLTHIQHYFGSDSIHIYTAWLYLKIIPEIHECLMPKKSDNMNMDPRTSRTFQHRVHG